MPQFVWTADFMNKHETKDRLGVPQELDFMSINYEVNKEFVEEGDL